MSDSAVPAAITPEDRDWTFVISEGCQECGFRPQPPAQTGERLRATIPQWTAALAAPEARRRSEPTTWSTVEYACHVRDACRIFRGRLQLMLTEDDPTFANWDQDATAVAENYFAQLPDEVSVQLSSEAEAIAAAFDAVKPDQLQRPGRRSNGSLFTISTFSVYFLHDVEHHVYDIQRARPSSLGSL
jgi:hypothetical protein